MKLVFSTTIILAVFLGWSLLLSLRLANPLFLPSPAQIIQVSAHLFTDITFWLDIFHTITRTTIGFGLACIVGIPLGFLLSLMTKNCESCQFLIDFFRSIPATALIPLFSLFFGIGDLAKILLIGFVCALIIAVNTMYGVKHAKALRLVTGRLLGLSKWKLFTKIIFPESLPYIFIGLRVAISSAFIVVIVSEMFIGTQYGLGHRIVDAQSVYDSPTMYIAIFLAGFLGYALNKLFILLEDNQIQWTKK